jgi:hypothetical protein
MLKVMLPYLARVFDKLMDKVGDDPTRIRNDLNLPIHSTAKTAKMTSNVSSMEFPERGELIRRGSPRKVKVICLMV